MKNSEAIFHPNFHHLKKFFKFIYFERERERDSASGGGAERDRERERGREGKRENPKEALC